MADGRISRVEELRTTPEEWTVIVDRMRSWLFGNAWALSSFGDPNS